MQSHHPQLPENVTVVLEISDGSFVDGFSVKLQILEDGRTIQEDNDLPNIPAAPEMPQLYQDWQNISGENSRTLQAVPAQITNVATLETWRNRTEELENFCRSWFMDNAFNSLRDRIRANTRVSNDKSVPIIIKCQTENHRQNEIIRRIPWHTWNLFSQLPNAEFALFGGFRQPVPMLRPPVRILAIFGSSQGGLQLEQDEVALTSLEQRGAQITKIFEPDEDTLSHLLFDEEWQILFFAGHSSSEGISGQIQISDGTFLPLHSLRQRLTSAVRNGLKLAIFNSCDGLRIADFLCALNIPAVIVMREPVPDRIAYEFLRLFLEEFSQNSTPLCKAMRTARDRLEALQRNFPAASWLPTICLNPNQSEFVWPNLTDDTPPVPIIQNSQPNPPTNGLFLRLRWRSLSLHLQIMLGLVAVVGIISVATLVKNNRYLFSTSISSKPTDDTTLTTDIEKLISSGENLIDNSIIKLSEPYSQSKLDGIEAFGQRKYENAWRIFNYLLEEAKSRLKQAESNIFKSHFKKAALATLRDPEMLIYRNNAFVNSQYNLNRKKPIYTIAVAAPLNTEAGLDILRGVAQAQDVAVNRDNFNLEVVIANDQNDTNRAKEVAQYLSNNRRILAVVGHYTSSNTCAALKTYSLNHLVLISPTSSMFNLGLKCNDSNNVFFRNVFDTRVEAESLVLYLFNNLNKRTPKAIVFYNSKDEYSKDLLKQFEDVIKTFSGRIIDRVDLLNYNFDNMSKLQEQINNADAVVLLPDGGTNNSDALDNAIKIINLNKGKKPILAANSMYHEKVINQVEDTTLNNLFMAVDWHPKQCGAENFRKKINEYWGGDLNRRTALTYEAVQAVVEAIKLSDTNVTRQEIRQKLLNTATQENKAAKSEVVEGLPIRFTLDGESYYRKDASKQVIVRGNRKEADNELPFEIVKNVSCQSK